MTLFYSSCTQTHLPTMSSHLHIIKYKFIYAKIFSLIGKSLQSESFFVKSYNFHLDRPNYRFLNR